MTDDWHGVERRSSPNFELLADRIMNSQREIKDLREHNERWHREQAEREERRHAQNEARLAKLEIMATRADTLRMIGAWVVSAIAAAAAAFSIYKSTATG